MDAMSIITTRLTAVILAVSALLCASAVADQVHPKSGSINCCEYDFPLGTEPDLQSGAGNGSGGAVRIGSRIFSCQFPPSELSYSMVMSSSPIMKCTCGKPQSNCAESLEKALIAGSGMDAGFLSGATQTRLPLSKFNDDFCDTGDDEPSTSACSGSSLAKNQEHFYCSAGIPRTIPLSRVDDGVVDCCDCSDEPRLRSTCNPKLCELEKFDLEREQRERDEIISGGLRELSVISKTSMDEYNKLKGDLNEQSEKSAQFAANLADQRREVDSEENIEKLEREEKQKLSAQKLVTALDVLIQEKDRLADVLAGYAIEQGEAGINQLRQIMMSQAVDEDVESCSAYRESVDSQNILDARIAAVVAWDESMHGSRDERINSLSTTLKLAQAPRRLLWRALNVLNAHNDHRRIVQLIRERTNAITEDADSLLDPLLNEIDVYYTRPEAENARNKLRELERQESEFRTQITNSEKLRTIDFGPNATLIALLNNEFTLRAGEHLYKLRPFDSCEQGLTSLGKYTGWKALAGDSAVIPQEINEGKSFPRPSILMTFENGQRCYQGTIRSTSVYMRCGAGNELLQVFEPEVCRYVYLFRTPVACLDSRVLGESSTFLAESLVSRIWRKAKALFTKTKQ